MDENSFGCDDCARLARIHADLSGWTTQIALEVRVGLQLHHDCGSQTGQDMVTCNANAPMAGSLYTSPCVASAAAAMVVVPDASPRGMAARAGGCRNC